MEAVAAAAAAAAVDTNQQRPLKVGAAPQKGTVILISGKKLAFINNRYYFA